MGLSIPISVKGIIAEVRKNGTRRNILIFIGPVKKKNSKIMMASGRVKAFSLVFIAKRAEIKDKV